MRSSAADQKFARNRKAIEIIRDPEETGRARTAQELDTLAGQTGWGAFGQELFKGRTPGQAREGQDEWLRIYLGGTAVSFSDFGYHLHATYARDVRKFLFADIMSSAISMYANWSAARSLTTWHERTGPGGIHPVGRGERINVGVSDVLRLGLFEISIARPT